MRGLSYTLLDLNGTTRELFPTGKSPEPIITKLSSNSFALGKDNQSYIVNTKGDMIQNISIKWSDAVTTVGM